MTALIVWTGLLILASISGSIALLVWQLHCIWRDRTWWR